MTMYRWRLARPGWLAGAATMIVAIVLVTVAAGWHDDVAGTIWTAHRVNIALATVAAAALKDTAAAVLDATPYGRQLRRLAPPGVALLTVGPLAAALASIQAVRVPGVPWTTLALQTAGTCAIACAAGACTGARVDPGLTGIACPALLLMLAELSPLSPYLDDAVTWLVLTVAGLVLLLIALRDPASR